MKAAEEFATRIAAHKKRGEEWERENVQAEVEAKLSHPMHSEPKEHFAEQRAKSAGKERAKHGKATPRVVPPVDCRIVREVKATLFAKCQKPDNTLPGFWLTPGNRGRFIAVETGLLEPLTRGLLPHTPDYFNLFKLPVVFNAAASKPFNFLTIVETLLEGDAQRIALLQEIFGACLDPWGKDKFFVAFVGAGSNGKSVILTVLTALLGAKNVSAVSLDRLTGERFAAFEMYGRLANLCGDQSYFDSKDEGRLKTITGGDLVTFEQKGRDPFSAVNSAKIIFACNTLPTFGDKTEATWDRLIAMPFNYRVPVEMQN